MTDTYLRSLGFAPTEQTQSAIRPAFSAAWRYQHEHMAQDGALLFIEHPLGIDSCRLSNMEAPLAATDIFATVPLQDQPALEQAVASAAESGLNREVASEIAYLSGIKPLTGAKLLGDMGGEPLAILCKATGMTRVDLRNLWRSMRRPEFSDDGLMDPAWERVSIAFEMLAVDRAQTVLRYWNWSLSSALTPALLKAIREGENEALDEYSAPERAAIMALAENFGR